MHFPAWVLDLVSGDEIVFGIKVLRMGVQLILLARDCLKARKSKPDQPDSTH